ncbi:EAL domain-containing protein [Actinoplanes sp. NPDC026670]|uniref:sensor domain-containing phosphodiesterase n=1 Tax=Actinoplanes sp. NPDC026670 TaxID=3154700 RepID=UPI0033FE7090
MSEPGRPAVPSHEIEKPAHRLIAGVIVVLGVSMLLTFVLSVWEWEDVVVNGEPAELDEWLSVVAICWLPVITVALLRLIDLQRRMRATAQAAVQAFESTVRTVSGWVWRTDADLRVTYSSDGVTTLLGLDPEQVVGSALDSVLTDSLSAVRANAATGTAEWANAAAGTAEWADSTRHTDDTIRHVRSNATPLRDGKGVIVGYHGFSTDVTAEVEATEEKRRDRQRHETLRAGIAALLDDDDALRIVLQVIVDLDTGRPVGAEALSRFTAEPYRPPNVWFEEAWQVGLGSDLELHAVGKALARLPELPNHAYLSVNVAPDTLVDPRFLAMLDDLGADMARIVVEITEHAVVNDYGLLTEIADRIRLRGGRLAVDDAGAGYATMQHILALRPDIIKLDRSIVGHADEDPARRALTAAMAAFASSLGTTVVAEGVETAGEIEVLLDTGVHLGQGFFLGRPAPDWPAENPATRVCTSR